MNILLTAPELENKMVVGGIISVVNEINNELQLPHSVFIRSPKAGSHINKIGQWIRIYFLFLSKLLWKRFDIIHIHTALNRNALWRDCILSLLSKLLHKKTLIHLHGGVFLFASPSKYSDKLLIKTIIKCATGIIVLSPLEHDSLIKLYRVKKTIFVLENTINLDKLKTGPRKEDISLHVPLRIMFMGRVTESKGIDDILDAFKKLRLEDCLFRFDLYGKSEYRNNIVAKFEGLLGKDNFTFHGIVTGDEKFKAIQQTDIFLLPSRYGEGLPITLLEAMAFGKIVITTDDASMGLLIKNNQNGFIVSKYNPEAIKVCIQYVLQLSNDQISELSNNAYDTVFRRSSIEEYCSNLLDIYHSLK